LKSLPLVLVLAASFPALGEGIAASVMPFSPNRASADLPGIIGLGAAVFAPINAGILQASAFSNFWTPVSLYLPRVRRIR
jgi:hypothetical protein